MVFIPTGERQVGTPGGAVLPSPSGVRLSIAGSQARAVSQLGGALFDVGLKAQRANDNAELKTETINAEAKLNEELIRIKRDVQDPEQYEIQARKALDDLIKDSSNKIGRRNKQKFQNVLNQLQLSAGTAISKEGFAKVVDKSKAAHTLLKDTVIQDIVTGKLTQAQGIGIVNQSTNELVSNDIFDQENKVAEDRGFGERVVEVAFESRFPDDPEGAVRELFGNKMVSEEIKLKLIDKANTKISRLNKLNKEARKIDRNNREREYRKQIRENPDFDIDDLIVSEEKNSDNPLSVSALIRTENFLNKVETEGGIGNATSFNALETLVQENPHIFRQTDVYAAADSENLNNDETEKLVEEWRKALQADDPTDPISTSRFKETTNSLKADFPVNEIDVDGFLTQSRDQDAALRYSRAWARNEAKATEKDFDLIAEEARLATLEFMDKRAKVKTSIRETQTDDLSAFELEQKLPSFEAPPISPLVESFREFLKVETKKGEVAKLKPEEQPKLDLLRLELNTIMQQAIDDFDAGIIDNEEFERITDEAANVFKEETKEKEEITSGQ